MPEALSDGKTVQLSATDWALVCERMEDMEAALIRVWWEFPQQHPDIAHIKELISSDGKMPPPAPRN